MIHNLKIKKEYMDAISSRKKTFEIRKNDRNFQVGDTLNFTIVETGAEYPHLFIVTYVLKDCPEYGLQDGYAILGIKDKYDEATLLLGDYVLEKAELSLCQAWHESKYGNYYTYKIKADSFPKEFEVDPDDADKLGRILDDDHSESVDDDEGESE